ncbi:hypothetical protein [Bradyrhizobium sp. USDA 313]|uniref:hypothetical protein n=1 Tax=Bradyrhizobium sp. USDA 313 TaxID=3156307 RepID=UPI003519221C
MRADVEFFLTLSGRRKRPDMPAWLEVLLNLSGYAGFVALASRGAACPQAPADDRICGDER